MEEEKKFLASERSVLRTELNELQRMSKDGLIEAVLHMQGMITSHSVEPEIGRKEIDKLAKKLEDCKKRIKKKIQTAKPKNWDALVETTDKQIAELKSRIRNKQKTNDVLASKYVIQIKENNRIQLELAKVIQNKSE